MTFDALTAGELGRVARSAVTRNENAAASMRRSRWGMRRTVGRHGNHFAGGVDGDPVGEWRAIGRMPRGEQL